MRRPPTWLWAGGGLVLALAGGYLGWKSFEQDDELEEQEERDMQRDNFWRAELAIRGAGRLKSTVDAFDCASDGTGARGDCGPKLVRFKELSPPTVEARPAPGFCFDHWESSIREPDGGVHGRAGKMPDGILYINGMGYSDTGQTETVTAVFVPRSDAHDGVQP